jgi:predicted RNA-binding protein with RPS1 domain
MDRHQGLVHVSELARDRVRNCEGFIKSMGVDELTVKYLGMEKGKAKLSRKAVLEEQFGIKPPDTQSPNINGSNTDSPPAMSEQEVDIIAQAIEAIKDM